MKGRNIHIMLAALVVMIVAPLGCVRTTPPETPGNACANRKLNELLLARNKHGYWTSNGKASLWRSCEAATELLRADGTPEEVAKYRAAAKELVGNIVMSLANPLSGYIFPPSNNIEPVSGHAQALVFLLEALQSDIEFSSEERKLTQEVILKAIKYIETGQMLALHYYLHETREEGFRTYHRVSKVQIDALKAAREAGYKVDERIFEMAEEYDRKESEERRLQIPEC